MISLLPLRRYVFDSEVSPAQFAALLNARAKSDPAPRHDQARFSEGISSRGFEIGRIGVRRNLFHARVRGSLEASGRGSRLLIEIKQSSIHIYLTIILALTITIYPILLNIIRGETTLEYEFRFFPARPLEYLGWFLFLPAAGLAINLILSWVFFPWELKKAKRYMKEVLELEF